MTQTNKTQRSWCFTLNNYTADEEAYLQSLDVKYLVYGREVAPTTGTKHLQGFVILKNSLRHSTIRKLLPRCHVEPKKASNEQAAEYCKKDGDFVEVGDPIKKQGKRSDLEIICKLVDKGESLSEIAEKYPATYVRNYRGIKDYMNVRAKPYTPTDVRGLWYVGEPGTGKTKQARELFPDAYLKSQNKWWDGYQGQKSVILDDLDKGGVGLGHLIKIWADRYSCTAETKGAVVNLVHEKLIVTSNYTIDELWGDDAEMCKAIKRRFEVVQFGKPAGRYVTGFEPNKP